MTVHVIVPVHNRAPITARFLDALVQQTLADYRLILVDDGCTDDTVAIARRKLPGDRLVVLTGDGTLWWAGALQAAYRHLAAQAVAEHDSVLIVNDDVSFRPDFLEKGIAVLAARPDACVQAVGVDDASGGVDRGAMADLARLRFRAAEPGEGPNCLSTRGLLMAARTFLRSGGFRPRWLPHYLSDYEFTLRLRRRGIPLMVDERFTAKVAFELTGLEEPPQRGARRYWRESFSNRAKFNPKHWSAFVIMACPAGMVPAHLARIWFGFAKGLLRALAAAGDSPHGAKG